MSDERKIGKAAQGLKMQDAFVLRMFKAMGLSENTMAQIERDLRTQKGGATKEQPKSEEK